MGDARTMGLQHRWVAVSFLLTAGLALLVLLLTPRGVSRWISSTALIPAAIAGSYLAARLGPLRRALEPATGALTFFALLLSATVFVRSELDGIGDTVFLEIDLVHVVVSSCGLAIGAIGGARWGRRRDRWAPRPLGSALIAAILVGGGILTAAFALALPVIAGGAEPATAIIGCGITGGILAGSFAAQAIAPSRRVAWVAAGAALAFWLPLSAALLVRDPSVWTVASALGIAVFWLPLTFLVAALGARLGWALADKHRARAAEQATAARVIS